MCACYRGYLGNIIKADKTRFGGACETARSCGQDVERGETRLDGDTFTVLLQLGRRVPRWF